MPEELPFPEAFTEVVVTGDFNRPKQTYEEWVAGLSPEEEAVRQAMEHRADQDMLADVYRRVDPSVRPGGEYGILSALGQSRDGGARYKGCWFRRLLCS